MSSPTMTSKKLDRKDVTRVWWRWWAFLSTATSVERLQALPFCYSLLPVLEKLYTDKESLSAALKRHLTFFNTQGIWGSIIHGTVVAMEEQKAGGADIPDEAITGLKTGLMGPLAGIGDTIDWLTISPLLVSLFLPFALEGSWVGSIGPLLIFTAITVAEGYYLFHLGYDLGKESIVKILDSGRIKSFILGTSVLGLFMMGALSSTFVKVSTPLVITVGEQEWAIQAIFDRIAPGILPLLVVAGVYVYLERKGPKYLHVILGLLIIGIVGAAFGIL